MRSLQRLRRPMTWLILVLLIFFLGPMLVYVTGGARLRGDWRMASHEPAGLAPDPTSVREAVVHVYAARAFAWRGAFSVHTWVAVKPANAERYTRYEVIGWRAYRGLSPATVPRTHNGLGPIPGCFARCEGRQPRPSSQPCRAW